MSGTGTGITPPGPPSPAAPPQPAPSVPPAAPQNTSAAFVPTGVSQQDIKDFHIAKGAFAAAYSAYDDILHVICIKADLSVAWIAYHDPKKSLDDFKTGTLPNKAADGARVAVVAKSAVRGKPQTYTESRLYYQDNVNTDRLVILAYDVNKAIWTDHAQYSGWDGIAGSHLATWWPADSTDPLLVYQNNNSYIAVMGSSGRDEMKRKLDPNNDPAFANSPRNIGPPELPVPFSVWPIHPTESGSNNASIVYTTPMQQASVATVEYIMSWKPSGADGNIDLTRVTERSVPDLKDPTVKSLAATSVADRAFLYSSLADGQWHSAVWDYANATCPPQSGTTVLQPQLDTGLQLIQLGREPQDIFWMMYVDSPGYELKIRKDADKYTAETILTQAQGWFSTPAPVPAPVPVQPTPPPIQPVNPPPKPSNGGGAGTDSDRPDPTPNNNQPIVPPADKPDVNPESGTGGDTASIPVVPPADKPDVRSEPVNDGGAGSDRPAPKPDNQPVVPPADKPDAIPESSTGGDTASNPQPVREPVVDPADNSNRSRPEGEPAGGTDADDTKGSPAPILRPPRPSRESASDGTPFCKEVIMPQSDKTAMHAASLDSNHRAMAVMAPKEKLWELGKSPTITYSFLAGNFEGTVAQHRKVAETVKTWSKYANLAFQEVPDNSDVRITFDASDGSWSLVGSDCAKARIDEATMNLGWIEDTSRTSEKEKATILHEFGHVLGMLHEHQSPAHGGRSVVDPNKAVKFYMASQGWSEEMVWEQIINTLTERDVSNFSDVDTHSIMHYAMPSQVTGSEAIEYNYKLSDLDKAFAVINYPRSLAAEAAMTDEKAWTLQHALDVVGITQKDPKMSQRILKKRDEITNDNTSPLSELRDLFTEWTHAAQRARMQARGDNDPTPKNRGEVGTGNQQGIKDDPSDGKDDIELDPQRPGADVSCDLVVGHLSALACGYEGRPQKSAGSDSQGRSHALNDTLLLNARDCLKLGNRATNKDSDRTEITWTINWRRTGKDDYYYNTRAEIREEDAGHSVALVEEALASWKAAADITFTQKTFDPNQDTSLDDFLAVVHLVFCFQDAYPCALADCMQDVKPDKLASIWRSHYVPVRRANSVEHFTNDRDALLAGQPDLERLGQLLEPATTYDVCLRLSRDQDTTVGDITPGVGETWSGRTAAIRTICHEVGHFLGLDHESRSIYSRILRAGTTNDPNDARGVISTGNAYNDRKKAVDKMVAKRLKQAVGTRIAGKLDRGSVMDTIWVTSESGTTKWYASETRRYNGFYTVCLPSDIDCANLAMLYPGAKMANATGSLLTNSGRKCKDATVSGNSRLANIWRTLVLPMSAYEAMAALAKVGAWDQMRSTYLELLSAADARFIQQLKIFEEFGLGDIDPAQLYDYHVKGPGPAQPYAYLPGMLPIQYAQVDTVECTSLVQPLGHHARVRHERIEGTLSASESQTIVTFRFAQAVKDESVAPDSLVELAKLIADSWKTPFFALEYAPDLTRQVDIIIAMQKAKQLPVVRYKNKTPFAFDLDFLPVCYALPHRRDCLRDIQAARDVIARTSPSDVRGINMEIQQRAARPMVEHDICLRSVGRPTEVDVLRQLNGAIGHLLGLTHQPGGLISTLCEIGWSCAHTKLGYEYQPEVLGAIYKALEHLFKAGAVTPMNASVGRFSQGSLMDHGPSADYFGSKHIDDLWRKSAATPTRYDFACLALLYPSRWLARDEQLCKFDAGGISVKLTSDRSDPGTTVRLLCDVLDIDPETTNEIVGLAIGEEWDKMREVCEDALTDANKVHARRIEEAMESYQRDSSTGELTAYDEAWSRLMLGNETGVGRQNGIDDDVDTSDEEDMGSEATTDEMALDSNMDEEPPLPPNVLARHVLLDPDPCRTCKDGAPASVRPACLARDGESVPARLSYHIVGHTGTRSRHASAAENAIVKQALAAWRSAVFIDFAEGGKDADMIVVFAKSKPDAEDTTTYSASGSYCAPTRVRPSGGRKPADLDIEHDICLRGSPKDLARSAVHMIGHFLGLSSAHVGLVNNYLSGDSTIKLDSDAEENFLSLVKDEKMEVQYAVDLGSVMDDLEGIQHDLALRAVYIPSEFDLAQVALSHPGPQLYNRKPTALFKRAMQVLDVPADVETALEGALQRKRWSMARSLWQDRAAAIRKELPVRCSKLERRLIRRLPKKPGPVVKPPPPSRPLPVDPTPPAKAPAKPPVQPSKEHGMDPLRMRDLSADETAALAKTKAAMNRTFPNFKITLWEKLNSFFGPSGQSDSFLSVQSPTRYLDKEEFAYDLEGIYSNFVKPVAVNEAEFRLTDELFSPARVVSAPNGRSLSMVYEQAIMNLIPKYGEDGDQEIRTAREGLAAWLLEETTDRESLYVNNGDLLDRPNSIIPTEEAARAARGQVTATPRKASRMEAAEHFMNTYYNEEIRWKTDKTDIITRAMNSSESVRVRQLEAATRLIANTSAARQAKLSFLYNDAVVRGHLHDVRECVAQLDIKTTAEFLQDAKDALRESAVASLYGASRVLPVIMQPLDWSQGLDTKFAPEDLSSDPDMIEIAIEAKTKQIDSFRRQLGLLQAHVSEDPQTLKDRFNTAADSLSKAEANLSGSYTENTAFAAGKIIDVVLAATAPEVLGVEGAAAEGVEAELYDSQAIMSKLNGATGEAAQETSKLQDIIKALDPKATLEGLVKGITDVNVAQAAVMKAAAEYSSRQTDWAKSMSATTAEQLAAVLRQIATATTELSDLRLKWKMAKVSRRKRDALVNKATNDANASKNNRTLLEAGAGKLKLPSLNDLKYQDEVNATKGGGSRWLSISLSSKTAASSTFSGDSSSSSHTGWDVNFFLAGGGKETNTAGSEHVDASNSSEVSVEISMNCTLVTVDRSSWFQPQFFGMSESFMRNSEHVRWSGKWPDEYRDEVTEQQTQPLPAFFGAPNTLAAQPPKGPFNPSLAVSKGVLADKYIDPGLLTCYPTGYIICKDVLIKISNLDLSNASSQKFVHEQVSSSGGFLFFRHTSTSETNTSTQSSNFQMASDGMIVRIPGPQIIGYIQQMVPYDQTTKYDPKYALKKAFHLPRIMPPADDNTTPQHAIEDRQRAIDAQPVAPAKTVNRSNGTAGEYREHHERASGQRNATRTTTKNKISKPVNGYGDTETEQDTDAGYGSRANDRPDAALGALDQMPDEAKEALYAYLGKTLGKKGSARR